MTQDDDLNRDMAPRLPFEPELCLIPAGEFIMGSSAEQDELADEDEQPQHRLYLPDYYLAKTPVTNAQYVPYVQATGHWPPAHWLNGMPLQDQVNDPVVHISWYDALAYCRWLSEVTGKAYGLPSEAEWEKGARGSDGRLYPWGNEWDAGRCSIGEEGVNDLMPVGTYPAGASPYGLLDMAGNVWEWTRSLDHAYPYQAQDGREDLQAKGVRVLRGGSWNSYRASARCAYRNWGNPYSGNNEAGFRVVLFGSR